MVRGKITPVLIGEMNMSAIILTPANREREMKPESIMIDDQKYVRADVMNQTAEKMDGMKYCIVRTYSAGVFAGYVESRNGQECVLRKSRGLWYWDGACGLSQLAVDGTMAPKNCKFTVEVDKREVIQTIEILECSEKSRKSIQGVEIWKK
jgi:hypothetical protein